tara:strand:+ start:2317 stop:2442 length:126 start_codon:yes stop_codon:yes gene_type:complete
MPQKNIQVKKAGKGKKHVGVIEPIYDDFEPDVPKSNSNGKK